MCCRVWYSYSIENTPPNKIMEQYFRTFLTFSNIIIFGLPNYTYLYIYRQKPPGRIKKKTNKYKKKVNITDIESCVSFL